MLEGPGSEERREALRRRFARVSASLPSGRRSIMPLVVLCVLTFVITLVVGLALTSRTREVPVAGATSSSKLMAPPLTYVRTCEEAEASGLAPIPRSSPLYRENLDADGDGMACEPYAPRTIRRLFR
jgi:hypothetical protein